MAKNNNKNNNDWEKKQRQLEREREAKRADKGNRGQGAGNGGTATGNASGGTVTHGNIGPNANVNINADAGTVYRDASGSNGNGRRNNNNSAPAPAPGRGVVSSAPASNKNPSGGRGTKPAIYVPAPQNNGGGGGGGAGIGGRNAGYGAAATGGGGGNNNRQDRRDIRQDRRQDRQDLRQDRRADQGGNGNGGGGGGRGVDNYPVTDYSGNGPDLPGGHWEPTPEWGYYPDGYEGPVYEIPPYQAGTGLADKKVIGYRYADGRVVWYNGDPDQYANNPAPGAAPSGGGMGTTNPNNMDYALYNVTPNWYLDLLNQQQPAPTQPNTPDPVSLNPVYYGPDADGRPDPFGGMNPPQDPSIPNNPAEDIESDWSSLLSQLLEMLRGRGVQSIPATPQL